jgi:hypothetical protein
MTNESCTRREGVEGELVAKKRKRDRRTGMEGRTRGLPMEAKMKGCGGWMI